VAPETTWLLLRLAGLVALAALTLSVASGLAGPAVRAPAWRGVLVALHHAAALVGLSLILGHVALAVADPWVDVSAASAAVPGASAWEPWWISVGAVAVDLLLVVAVTSALRGRRPRTWWTLHVLTYPAWMLASAHALAIGTDTWRAPYLVAGIAGVALVATAGALRVAASRRGLPVGVPPRPTAVAAGGGR
jgi:sulfoxide reductase heme-binding subunit YedZ